MKPMPHGQKSLLAEKLVKFCVVGGTGVIVNTVFLWLLHDRLGFDLLIASPVSVELSIFNNFFWNDWWTFNGQAVDAPVVLRLLKFNLISLGGLAITTGVLYALNHYFGVYYLLANLVGIVFGTLWNFGLNAVWTWRLVGLSKAGLTVRSGPGLVGKEREV
jgi:dolichol-phosphate mannosyltransferase